MADQALDPHRRSWTRRALLAAGVGASTAFAGVPARASTTAKTIVGDAEVTVLSDGHLVQPMAFILPDRPEAEIAALMAPHNLPIDAVQPDCNLTLLRIDGRVVLFDAGSGPLFQSTVGKLPASLAAAGVDPAEITDICFTHAHPDHLWGVLDDFDEPVFPNVRCWMNRIEWDFWRAPGTLDAMPEARKTFVVGAQNRLERIEHKIALFDAGTEPLPGIEAVASTGHTPGHTSFLIHRGGEGLLVVGDAITNAVISFERPDWHTGSDQDPSKGADTRRGLLDRLAADRTRIVGFHLPYPGIGTVERAGAHYRFAPTA